MVMGTSGGGAEGWRPEVLRGPWRACDIVLPCWQGVIRVARAHVEDEYVTEYQMPTLAC